MELIFIRVAFFIFSLQGGGAERVVSVLSKELSIKYDINLILLNPDIVDYEYRGNIITLIPNIAKYRMIHKDGKVKIPILLYPIISLYAIYRLNIIIKKYDLKLIFSLLPQANFLNFFCLNKVKKVLSIHSYESIKTKSFLQYLHLLPYKMNKNNHVVSKTMMNKMINEFKFNKENIAVIYNPISFKDIEKMMLEDLEENYLPIFRNKVLICVGRLVESKRHVELINLFKDVLLIYKDVVLVIMGKGPLEETIKEHIIKLGLENRVFMLGFQKNPYKYLYNSSLFISLSSVEGLPLSFIESMACGLPIISTDCETGPREILSGEFKSVKGNKSLEFCEYGILIPDKIEDYYNGHNYLADAVKFIFEYPEIYNYYVNVSKKRAMDFDIGNIIKQYQEFFDCITND